MAAKAIVPVLAAAILFSALGKSNADDTVLNELYGSGVHAYFGGDFNDAHASLSKAIDQGTKDPRCFYYRGLSLLNLGRPEAAEKDFKMGAELEAAGSGEFLPISRSLQRIQGNHRLELESFRMKARIAVRERELALKEARYEQLTRAEGTVLRTGVIPRAQFPELPNQEDPTAPFGGMGNKLPTAKVDTGRPFINEGGTTTPATGGDDPFGTPTTNPAGGDDPFGSDPTPAAGSDPFGTDTTPAGGDPFGTDAKPTGGDPFGTDTTPAGGDPFGTEPAGDVTPAGGDPFGSAPAEADPFGASTKPGADPFGSDGGTERGDDSHEPTAGIPGKKDGNAIGAIFRAFDRVLGASSIADTIEDSIPPAGALGGPGFGPGGPDFPPGGDFGTDDKFGPGSFPPTEETTPAGADLFGN